MVCDIRELLAALDLPMHAVAMVAFHRPVHRISYLRDVLAKTTSMPIVIANAGQALDWGKVYIGEPKYHLKLLPSGDAELVADLSERDRAHTIDMLFCSLALNAGRSAVGVVLSGALDDGSRGPAAIHAAGGTTMVVTPDQAGERGMPGNAIALASPIDVIGSPRAIAASISQILSSGTSPN